MADTGHDAMNLGSHEDPEGAGASRERRRERSFTALGATVAAPVAAPGLHVVATPIGNLADITLRALGVMAGVDVVLAEDTRVSRVLLSHYGIDTPLLPYHEHNAASMRPQILARLARGEALALISDAGTPLVSDPGYKLVGDVVAAGHPVTALPGASAVMAALVLGGLPTDRFFFEGFLPEKSVRGARVSRISRPYPVRWCFLNRHGVCPTPWPISRPSSGRGRPPWLASSRRSSRPFVEGARPPLRRPLPKKGRRGAKW